MAHEMFASVDDLEERAKGDGSFGSFGIDPDSLRIVTGFSLETVRKLQNIRSRLLFHQV